MALSNPEIPTPFLWHMYLFFSFHTCKETPEIQHIKVNKKRKKRIAKKNASRQFADLGFFSQCSNFWSHWPEERRCHFCSMPVAVGREKDTSGICSPWGLFCWCVLVCPSLLRRNCRLTAESPAVEILNPCFFQKYAVGQVTERETHMCGICAEPTLAGGTVRAGAMAICPADEITAL